MAAINQASSGHRVPPLHRPPSRWIWLAGRRPKCQIVRTRSWRASIYSKRTSAPSIDAAVEYSNFFMYKIHLLTKSFDKLFKKQNATRSDPKTMTPYRQLISESEHRGRWRTAKFSTPKSGRGEANRLSPDADAVDGGPQPKCGRQNRFQNGRQKANRPISIRLPAAQLGGCGGCFTSALPESANQVSIHATSSLKRSFLCVFGNNLKLVQQIADRWQRTVLKKIEFKWI